MMIMLKNGVPCCTVDAQDRAFLYGDGFFTTIKVLHGEPLLWRWHGQRMQHSARQLGLGIDLLQIQHQVQQLLARQPQHAGILKIIVSRGVGSRGYLPPQQPPVVYVQFFADEPVHGAGGYAWDSVQDHAIESGLLQGTLGHVMPALSGLKTLNRLEQVLLRQELQASPWPEALVADWQGNIIEGVFSNCFLYCEGKWYTPALDQAGIAGVMRAVILETMQAHDMAHVVTPFPKAGLATVQALFFCNALSAIVPVRKLADRVMDLHPVQQLAIRVGQYLDNTTPA